MIRNIKIFMTGLLLSVSSLSFAQSGDSAPVDSIMLKIGNEVDAYLEPLAAIDVDVKVLSMDFSGDSVKIHFNNLMGDYPFRDSTVADVYAIAGNYFPNEKIAIYVNGTLLDDLKSRFYSSDPQLKGKNAKRAKKEGGSAMIENVSRPYDITEGLQNRHIAVWQSHGFYYDQGLQRWEWQRARIFQTVEDLYTQSYVLPFLVPMLENAGANVFLPRERDAQTYEVIVDNDIQGSGHGESTGANIWRNGDSAGFANPKPCYEFGENPFRMGSYRVVESISQADVKKGVAESVASWLPQIPGEGEYAVYVSYKTLPNSTDAAYYTVRYKGGESEYKVNQQMGGGTWIYLGTFKFDEGATDQGVYLTNYNRRAKNSKNPAMLTADAVKFGGGMGNIARNPSADTIPYAIPPQVSGYPRFTEGARYWLQWAGFADSVYSYTHNVNDYTDDYVSRGLWVNALAAGSEKYPQAKGLNIPIDLSFAFHTDAGTFLTDSIVGTLSIYTKISNDSDKYPNGESRMQGRELADLVQTQLVNDLRCAYEPKWSRRGLWDRSYAESRSPNVPAMLLEFLSHQNFADMKYGLDPSFRFAASRAIYKGMLRFLSQKYNTPYVVQPLPVKDFAATIINEKGRNYALLSWSATADTLEPTAVAKRYVVYTRRGEGGFDNGIVVDSPNARIPIEGNKIYSFKVVAINEGGASFPSQILSVAVADGAFAKGKTVLVVNGFERVSAPASYQSADSLYGGFNDVLDHGVPYIKDISYIGSQYEFRRTIPWRDDDAAGFGASNADYEDKVIAGNTFDYPYVHGKAFLELGYSFVSSSTGAVMNGTVSLNDYDMVDFIMGKQAQTKVGRGAGPVKYEVFPVLLREKIAGYANDGGNMLISGAFVASDLWDSYDVTDEGKAFATDVLKYRWMTHYASKDNIVRSVANPYGFNGEFTFNNTLNDKIYVVEAPDAMVPADKDAYTIFRYRNTISAGVAYKGDYKVVVLGVPVETFSSQEQIEEFMAQVTGFFEQE